jgi:hypothetical protein
LFAGEKATKCGAQALTGPIHQISAYQFTTLGAMSPYFKAGAKAVINGL